MKKKKKEKNSLKLKIEVKDVEAIKSEDAGTMKIKGRRKKYEPKVSLHPLSFEEAMDLAIRTKVPGKDSEEEK